MSLFLNSESVVINTTANIASSPLTVSRSTDHGLPQGLWPQHGLLGQYRSWTSTQSSAASRATDTIIALGGNAGQGHQHGLQGNRGHRHQDGPLQQPGPWTFPWLQVAAQITDTHMALGGNLAHRHQHSPQLQKDHIRIYPWPSAAAQTADIDMSQDCCFSAGERLPLYSRVEGLLSHILLSFYLTSGEVKVRNRPRATSMLQSQKQD